jgi:glycosyltransferase involved in cell wall biosynthesis
VTRLAYVCADAGVPVFGQKGSSVHVQEVIRALRAEGAHVTLFATRLGGPAPEDLEDVVVHALPPRVQGDAPVRERAALVANADLRAALAMVGDFDVVYERYSLWSYAGMEHARAMGIPGLLEVNAPLIAEQRAHRKLHHVAEAEDVAQRAFGAASTLLAVSRAVGDELAAHPAAKGRVVVVPNGVDPTRFDVPTHRSDDEAVSVGFVGTLKPWHGLDVLLEAFVMLRETSPRTRLVIIGDGPERPSLEARIAAAGLGSHVWLVGAVPPAAVPAWLSNLDIAVAPYPELPDFYFSPLKVFEYLAAGLPVVASRIGEIPELLEDGVQGVLCRPGDARSLADALARLAADPGLRRRLGNAGRELVARGHTWRGVARRILELAQRTRVSVPG